MFLALGLSVRALSIKRTLVFFQIILLLLPDFHTPPPKMSLANIEIFPVRP